MSNNNGALKSVLVGIGAGLSSIGSSIDRQAREEQKRKQQEFENKLAQERVAQYKRQLDLQAARDQRQALLDKAAQFHTKLSEAIAAGAGTNFQPFFNELNKDNSLDIVFRPEPVDPRTGAYAITTYAKLRNPKDGNYQINKDTGKIALQRIGTTAYKNLDDMKKRFVLPWLQPSTALGVQIAAAKGQIAAAGKNAYNEALTETPEQKASVKYKNAQARLAEAKTQAIKNGIYGKTKNKTAEAPYVLKDPMGNQVKLDKQQRIAIQNFTKAFNKSRVTDEPITDQQGFTLYALKNNGKISIPGTNKKIGLRTLLGNMINKVGTTPDKTEEEFLKQTTLMGIPRDYAEQLLSQGLQQRKEHNDRVSDSWVARFIAGLFNIISSKSQTQQQRHGKGIAHYHYSQ